MNHSIASDDAFTITVGGRVWTRATKASAIELADNIGVIRFNVEISVTMEELRTWDPDRVARFFRGIATVLMAKEGVPFVTKVTR